MNSKFVFIAAASLFAISCGVTERKASTILETSKKGKSKSSTSKDSSEKASLSSNSGNLEFPKEGDSRFKIITIKCNFSGVDFGVPGKRGLPKQTLELKLYRDISTHAIHFVQGNLVQVGNYYMDEVNATFQAASLDYYDWKYLSQRGEYLDSFGGKKMSWLDKGTENPDVSLRTVFVRALKDNSTGAFDWNDVQVELTTGLKSQPNKVYRAFTINKCSVPIDDFPSAF